MVMIVHSTEPFYLGGNGTLVLTECNAFWAAFFDSVVRSCVPLFVVMSSYLQFPLKYSTGEFFRRRASRILIPFAVWTIVYALVQGNTAHDFRALLLNFNYSAGHLWYVYMLIGLYLLMPMLSPWAERVGKKELQFYLGIWLFTTLIPLIRDWYAGMPEVVYGVGGIPRQALTPLWGEASWNAYGVFYYFSGFIGYLLLGLYFRKFVGVLSWGKTMLYAIPSLLIGFAISFGGFLRRVYALCGGVFPLEGYINKGVWLETTWCNDTLGVALMTIGSIFLLRKITSVGVFYRAVVVPVSKASYGMYLCHMLVLSPVCGCLLNYFGVGADGIMGFWTTPVEILLTAISSYISVAMISIAIQRIPIIGKYIIG